ncbi:MAG: ferrous iron transporter B [Clostridiales bacterium]|nr:ferrous iron transporter B [Candidatus Equinaster intestinalis]
MGLTASSVGFHLKHNSSCDNYDIKVNLSGNPNVGKSSVFNLLTGLHQHTGNWSGKTVETARGTYSFSGKRVLVTDLPGCYSLDTHSSEEEVAKRSILEAENAVNVIVCDAALLCRNLNLFFQIAARNRKVILCVNLTDEAAKHGIFVDTTLLSSRLNLPVISTCAKNGKGIERLKEEIEKCADLRITNKYFGLDMENAEERIHLAEQICDGVITRTAGKKERNLKIDRLITSKTFGLPFMFLMLMFLFWLTISASNYPSQLLSSLFTRLENPFYGFLLGIGIPAKLCELLVFGIYRVVGFIVSVMLPPMSIFFPLFTLMEDLGLLPRIAFNMDRCFKKCNTCGKQCLTMCMGLGCNAAGVVGARIIDSPRERLIAIITNSLVPCNGRFPTLITMISLFFVAGFSGFAASFLSACILSLFIISSVLITLLSSFFL